MVAKLYEIIGSNKVTPSITKVAANVKRTLHLGRFFLEGGILSQPLLQFLQSV
jgi:hypothetical protein